MPVSGRDVALALNRSVKEDQRSGTWWVAEKYDAKVTPEGKRYIIAPGSLPSVDEPSGWEQYRPLLSHPYLFLSFARLAEGIDYSLPLESKKPMTFPSEPKLPPQSDNNTAIARRWAEDYGVLGLTRTMRGLVGDPRGGEADTVEAFCDEVSWAHAALTLYEAGTDPGEVDLDFVASYAYDALERLLIYRDVETARRYAVDTVMSIIELKIEGLCHPLLYRDGDHIVQRWRFDSLLGAMWLQMLWLVTSKDAPRRCAGPGCNRIISYEQPRQPQERGGQSVDPWKKNDRSRGYKTRKDKKFCSDTCRVKNWQHKQKN